MGRPRRPQTSTYSPRRAKAVERQRQAIQLRIAGATFAQIGAELGITPQGAEKAVIAGLREHTREAAENCLPLELERLDRLQLAWWGPAVNGDVQAANIVLKISERRSKLLGLDAPTKTDARIAALSYHEVNLGGEGVLTIRVQGDQDDYIAGLRAMRGEGPFPAIEASSTVTDSNQDD
jgi:hypothetical protein